MDEKFREAYFAINYTMDDQYFIIGRAGGNISIVGVDEPSHYSVCFFYHLNFLIIPCLLKLFFHSKCENLAIPYFSILAVAV